MINPISSASAATETAAPQCRTQPKSQAPASSEPRDSVQLGAKAQVQASGDVDHDGDSR